jgi:hypothetical protein
MKNLEAVLLFGALVIFLSQTYYALPITSDAYENLRIVNYLQAGGNFPIESAAIGGEPYIYPPVFSLAIYQFMALTGFDYYFSLNFFSYFFLAILVFSAYLLLKSIQIDEDGAVLGAFAIFGLPIFVFRIITPIAETLGLAFFLLSLIAYSKKKYEMLFFILLIFPFAHSRSFIFTLITLALATIMRGDYQKSAKSVIGGIIVFVAYHLAYPIYSSNFENAAVTIPSFFEVLPIIPIVFILIGAYLLLKKKGMIDEISLSIIGAFAISFFLLPFPFRHAIFLLIPMAALTSQALSADRRILVVFAVFLPLVVFQIIQMRTAPFNYESIHAMDKFGSMEETKVLASFKNNYALPVLSNKKVIVGAFAEGLFNGAKRASELQHYFSENGDFQRRQETLRTYNIEAGFFEKGIEDYLFEQEIADKKVFESDKYAAFVLK